MRSLFIIFSLFIAVGTLSCDKLGLKAEKGEVGAPEKAQAAAPEVKEAEEPAKPEPKDESPVLAKINGKPITDAEVYERVKNRLRKLESQMFDIKMKGLTRMIDEKLLETEAEKRKISTDELVKKEVESKVVEPTEKEIDDFYAKFKDRLKNQPLEKVKSRLIAQIKAEKRQNAYSKLVDKLEKKAKVEILIERPRVEISVDDDPSQGKKGAPITLIEFSDFQCPFCKRVRPTLSKIMDTYKGKVYYVFRDFPLSFHKNAEKAAQAANCAGDQDKYWKYNTHIWENQRELQIEKLKEYAKTLGLNESKFNECLDSDKYADEIAKDMKEGSAAGVTGTPAYFVNGIFISGAQPFENFKDIIDTELKMRK